jgi:Holliday junction resolvase RusA-like endonuclease
VSFRLGFSVPWPPTQNHCYVTTKFGRRVLTHTAKKYQIGVACLVNGKRNENPLLDLPGWVVVEATYYKPDRRKRDTDNIRKVLADAVADGLGVDDSQFLWRDQDIQVDRESPRVELVIYPKEQVV